tara:strand:- start:3927 stop:6653 length:2727 start_codon:yes stop_codon:yes gene_type:complete
MSIKTIDRQDTGTKGVKKRIDAGAEKLVYDILQQTQYSTPIQSSVRELTTNAWDSQREKEVAIEVLTGKSKSEDYYIERHGEQYEDSNFDASYYDLKYLDTENNTVELTYIQEEGTGFCDTFRVQDFGVGLGGKRLEGILNLGYSTKRNTSEGFGAFGLGAKVAFSTGVAMYTVETVHNGKRFKCVCYPYRTEFIISKFAKDGTMNDFITFSDGTKVYYEKTSEKNNTIVSFGVKKHNRYSYRDAVDQQLIYIDGVNFTIKDVEESGEEFVYRSKSTKAEVVYNSESLIISNGTVFNRPHIVLVKDTSDESGINYGYVDFRELELQDMYGSIGFKCPMRQTYRDESGVEIVIQDGVSVTPSREKVIWNDATKAYILSVIETATKEASDIVQDRLQNSTELFDWLEQCAKIFHRNDSEDIINKMSNIINNDDLSPVFVSDSSIKYLPISNFFTTRIKVEKVSVDYRGKVNREEVSSWKSFNFDAIYVKDTVYSPVKDLYICKGLDKGTFISISLKGWQEDESKDDSIKELASSFSNFTDVQKKKYESLEEFILNDAKAESYANVEVPADFLKTAKIVEDKEGALSPAEQRALENKEVGFSLRYDPDAHRSSSRKTWTWDKVEPKGIDLITTDKEVYYGGKEDEESLVLAAGILYPSAPAVNRHNHWGHAPRALFTLSPSVHYNYSRNTDQEYAGDGDNKHPQLIRLSSSTVKKVEKANALSHIENFFFFRTVYNFMETHPMVRRAYTVRKINDMWPFFDGYLRSFDKIDQDIAAKARQLRSYLSEYDKFSWALRPDNPVWDRMDELYNFQVFCANIDSEDEDRSKKIAQKSFETFIFTDIEGANVVDLEILSLYEELKTYAKLLDPMFKDLPCTTFMQDDSADEITKYIKLYNRDQWEWDNKSFLSSLQ